MLGIAIVGAGAIAGVHIDAYKEFGGDCEIRAVCDLYVNKAEELLEKKEYRTPGRIRVWRKPWIRGGSMWYLSAFLLRPTVRRPSMP